MANFSSPSASLLDVTPADKADTKLNLDSDLRADALKTAIDSSAVAAADESLVSFVSPHDTHEVQHASHVSVSTDLLNTPDLSAQISVSERQSFKQKITDLLERAGKNLDREKFEVMAEAARKELLAPVLAVFSTRKTTAVAAGMAGGLLIVPQVIPLLAGVGAAAGIYNFSKSAGLSLKKD